MIIGNNFSLTCRVEPFSTAYPDYGKGGTVQLLPLGRGYSVIFDAVLLIRSECMTDAELMDALTCLINMCRKVRGVVL